jgi:hypothetical protein
MLDSKFFFTLVGLVVAVFAICNTNMSGDITEGWGMNPSRTVKVMREVHPKTGNGFGCGKSYSLQNNYQSMLGNDKFISRPNFQGLLSPRGPSVDYGANIRYNMPSYKNQGIPCDPLAFGDMAKENYKGPSRENFGCSKGRCGGGCGNDCGVASCGKGGVSLGGLVSSGAPGDISGDSNYVAAMNKIYSSSNTSHSAGSLLAVGDMTTINSVGEVEQPIVYDRYIYANQKSRLRSQGDMIRGDLPIVPCSGNWFSVHPTPNIDLQAGAMNVMGGNNNQTTQALSDLIYATSGGYETAIAGVNMAPQFNTMTGGSGNVMVTAFP